jgi:acyl-CoA synthetase (AMP-forming)/AMP-acid ligase II
VEHVVEFYGATEGNAGLMNNFDKVGALGFVPRILDLVYPLKIVRPQEDDKTKPYRDPKTGRCVDSRPNEVGLLLSKIVPRALDSRFDGYTDSKSSAEKVVHDVHTKGDAYFNTGDLLSRDWYGFYYWSDRVGDTFRWKVI